MVHQTRYIQISPRMRQWHHQDRCKVVHFIHPTYQIDGQTRKGHVKGSPDNILLSTKYMFTVREGHALYILGFHEFRFVLFSDRGNHPSSASCKSEKAPSWRSARNRAPGKLRRGNHNRTPEKSIWELREIHLGSGANRRPLVPIVGQGGAAQGWLRT